MLRPAIASLLFGSISRHLPKAAHASAVASMLRMALRCVLAALRHAHSRGFVHCDIKPENVYYSVAPTGEITYKLGDFGLATFADETGATTDRVYAGTMVFMDKPCLAAWERDEQWAVCCCVDPTFCCAWGEDENCKSRDEDWEDEEEGMRDEELVERVDAMKREVDALLALVVVLLVVVGALIVYLVPWRRRPAFASPSLSVELNPTTYNELGRGSSVVEGI